ncbi:MAG TPA: amidohydrolase family protein [Acidimicrobiia bacterium]|nr:amidohydrolase family protein [Acidimicrobiia bacterium]
MATARCSFCGRNAEVAGSVVAGPRGIGICGDCAAVAAEVALDTTRPEEIDRVVTSIGCLITNDRRNDGLLGWVPDAAVAIRRGRVTWVGSQRHLPSRYAELPVLDAGGRIVCPGFIDAGTDLLGTTPGLQPEAAVERAADLAAMMIQEGVTSFDLAVGGSDDPLTETVALAAGRGLAEKVAASVTVSWRVPPTMTPEAIRRILIPAASRLASNAIVSCHAEPHGAIEARLDSIRPLRPRIVVCDEPAECIDAAEGALSISGAGHLSPVDGVVSIVEPLTLLDGRSLPARKLWDAGAVLGLASRNDPDRRLLRSPAFMITLLVEVGGLSISEAIWSATRGGALALGDPERGRVRPGDIADLIVLDTDSLGDLIRLPDSGWASSVLRGGVVVATRP